MRNRNVVSLLCAQVIRELLLLKLKVHRDGTLSRLDLDGLPLLVRSNKGHVVEECILLVIGVFLLDGIIEGTHISIVVVTISGRRYRGNDELGTGRKRRCVCKCGSHLNAVVLEG